MEDDMTAMVTHKIVLKRDGRVFVDGRFVGTYSKPEKGGNPICRRKEWTFRPWHQTGEKEKIYAELTRNRLLSAIDVYAIFN